MVDAKMFSNAVWSGDFTAVDALLAAGADINAADPPRWPPIYLALEQMWVGIVRRLIEAGADVNQPVEERWTPLSHAIDIDSDSASQVGKTPNEVTTAMTELLLGAGAVPTVEALDLCRHYRNHKAEALLIHYEACAKSCYQEK